MLGKMGTYSNCAASLFGHTMTILMIDISTIAVSTMTLERYIAVLHPFVYKLVVTKERILLCVCIGSTVFLVVVALSLVFRRLMDGWIILQSTIFFLFTAFAYTRIFLVVKILAHPQNKVHEVSTALEGNLSKTKMFLREIKHAKSCFMVLVCYVGLHYLPVMLILYFKYARTLNKFYTDVHIWVVTLGLLNSSVNSVIFFRTKKMLKREAAKFLRTFKL